MQIYMRGETRVTKDKFGYLRVLTGWHSSSQHHTYRKKEKRVRVNALGSDGGWQELSWELDGDYRHSKSVTGPSSLSPTISPEAPGISHPGITGSQASSIKVTLNGLIGSHTCDCESLRVCACEKDTRRKQETQCQRVNKSLLCFVYPSLLINLTFVLLFF